MIVDITEQCATIEMYIKDVFSKTTNLLEAKLFIHNQLIYTCSDAPLVHNLNSHERLIIYFRFIAGMPLFNSRNSESKYIKLNN